MEIFFRMATIDAIGGIDQYVNWLGAVGSGGSTYKNFRRAPPSRTQFFRFYIRFHQKAPSSEVDASSPPLRTGNPGPAPGQDHIHWNCSSGM